MLNGKRIAVVLPAYNAEKTLEATVRELPDLVDIRILVDDQRSPTNWDCNSTFTIRTTAMDATSKPATGKPWLKAPTS